MFGELASLHAAEVLAFIAKHLFSDTITNILHVKRIII